MFHEKSLKVTSNLQYAEQFHYIWSTFCHPIVKRHWLRGWNLIKLKIFTTSFRILLDEASFLCLVFGWLSDCLFGWRVWCFSGWMIGGLFYYEYMAVKNLRIQLGVLCWFVLIFCQQFYPRSLLHYHCKYIVIMYTHIIMLANHTLRTPTGDDQLLAIRIEIENYT